ncbi:hypothetical protein HCN44_011312 [Aphidius gifuensis]|uniref:Cytochrome b5 heme-binding domain-containing protein n=1 Tax=Aphidius gifuensis TaxID=684658 RepID=A0A834XXA5_APHGI|nr:cytochrome b5 [Aphidius gifuensis]KAF7994043.1 hypothetical protein HCN44_011312 [Aphidius gifuensis]
MSNEQQRKRIKTRKYIIKKSMDLLRLNIKSLKIHETINNDKTKLIKSSNCHDNNIDKKLLKIITMEEVAWHDQSDNCWIIIYDYVYDCTKFIEQHPGGHDVILEYAGRDATLAFVGTGHSDNAKKIMEKYLIGELPFNERLFRIPGGIKTI